MELDEMAAGAAAVVGYTMIFQTISKHNDRKKPKRKWIRPWIQRRTSPSTSNMLTLLNNELLQEDPLVYRNFLRMSQTQFDYLYNLVKQDIEKTDTHFREAIPGRNRLEVTLRFLATGESYRSLMYSTRIHESTISKFVPEVCRSIYNHLHPIYVKTPNTNNEWEQIAKDFDDIWQFPNCIGSLDGKHIKFRPPLSAGSYYYNYKGDHSIVLLALADAKYKFTYVNVFQQSKLSTALVDGSLNIPQPAKLKGRTLEVPYVIVADDAFPLTSHIMKPYPERQLSHDTKVFNYRLSRARRIIENAFGILANRFRILLNTINLSANKVELVTLACIAIHNYLVEEEPLHVPENTNENVQLSGITTQCYRTKPNTTSQKIRDEFKEYFMSPLGAVPWQEEAIRKNNL